MANSKPYRIKSITEIHRLLGLPKPHHPLIGIVDLSGLKNDYKFNSVLFDLYVVSLKRGCDKLHYGQKKYDFDEGLMAFLSPRQILRGEKIGIPTNLEGWMLFIHPDFLWGSTLANKIKKYEYFDYSVNEALFLSDKEETLINGIIENIKNEYHANIDKFSQDIIISHLETLLNYAERFYQRQFITRKIANHQILDRLEKLLSDYFKLIEKAKEKLSTTDLSISEIAYALGFEHLQSFSKLFKTKTKQSPLEFRQSFN